MKKIAILASGSGSNAENIAKYFEGSDYAQVSFIIANNPNALVLERAKRLGIESAVVTKSEFMQADGVVAMLQERDIDFVVLAGFLLLVPAKLIQAYPGRIVNIHPALLPKHGGKGMYGDNVHKAVVECGDTESAAHDVGDHIEDFFPFCVRREYTIGKLYTSHRCTPHFRRTFAECADMRLMRNNIILPQNPKSCNIIFVFMRKKAQMERRRRAAYAEK